MRLSEDIPILWEGIRPTNPSNKSAGRLPKYAADLKYGTKYARLSHAKPSQVEPRQAKLSQAKPG